MNSKTYLIDAVNSHCAFEASRIYDDLPGERTGHLRRIKLSGARITDDELKNANSKLVDYIVRDENNVFYKVTKISRNDYTTGGRYTSPDDVCIYLKQI